MTFDQATALGMEYSKLLTKNTFCPANGSFDHMTLRGGGYSRSQIANLLKSRDTNIHLAAYNDMNDTIISAKKRYFKELLNQ